ncbi:heterokaryon incompatibility protein-domain-containing protein [Cladorrhinum samala]|uniref:Heterokaryon incompatibility protein-domain-containing protein n=1 Tax=Cladorrhinum samala TaxID=585594 RepID=A0AAV9HH67_9PEZI|nr:heterokaryon incompatibility protein-domain-containing protein [Cladorrhinum samala]
MSLEHHHDTYAHSQTADVLLELNQQLIIVSEENKRKLLGDVNEARLREQNRARATAILNELERINPKVAQHFCAKSDSLADLKLRMIMPADHQPRQQIPSFIVVSYCWHYSSWISSPYAIVPGWEITKPMMDAVLGVRKSPDEGVWLDRLCINQGNENDKVTHIATMDTIYHSARRMAILLEDVHLSDDEESAGLAYAKFYDDMSREAGERGLQGAERIAFIDEYFPRQEKHYHECGRDGELAAAKPFVMKLLAARWFTRAWCAHESRIHPHRKVDNPLFMCFGPTGEVLSFEFRFVYYLAMYLDRLEPEDTNPNGVAWYESIPHPNHATLRQLWWRLSGLVQSHTEQCSPLQHLASITIFDCFRKADLMSIALNTAGIALYFDGQDVQSIEDVKWVFSLLVLAAGDLVPLVVKGPKLRVPSVEKQQVVSWAIDPPHITIEEHLENPLPQSITAVTGEYIELDLIVFSSQPRRASESSLAIAKRIIAEHDLESLAVHYLAAAPKEIQHPAQMLSGIVDRINAEITLAHAQAVLGNLDMIRLSLAVAIDAGLDWILAFPSSFAHATETWQHGIVDGIQASPPDARILSAASSLLSHLSPLSTDSEPHLAILTRFFNIILDPRSSQLCRSSRLLPVSPLLGDYAITTPASNRSYLAVPLCLAHLPPWHDYCWVIEPFDPSAEPEDPKDHLAPHPSTLEKRKKGEPEIKIEDFVPVLTTDYPDRRAPPRPQGEWRLRTKQALFGTSVPWDGEGLLKRVMEEEQDEVKVLRKQKVFGAESYDWTSIRKAMVAVTARALELEREEQDELLAGEVGGGDAAVGDAGLASAGMAG